MPETVPTSTSDAGSSTATSTADIAASVISEFAGSDSSDSTPVADSATKPTDQNTPPADDDDFDAVQAETTDPVTGRKRVNSIPQPRVKTMIEKKVAARERELITTVAKELGITKAEAELKLDDVLGGLRERGTKFTEYEARVQGVESVEALMAKDPARFMELLTTINPGYKEWQRAAAAAQQNQPQNNDNDPEPEPDYDLGNGQMTYSLKGMRLRDEWKERQIIKKLEGTVGERLKPFEDERKERAEREEAQQAYEARATDLKRRLEVARKWPQFKENEPHIQTYMEGERKKGNFVRFEDAYMAVVMPKLAADRTRIRQEVIEEENAQPKTTGVTTTPGAPKAASDKPKTTAEIAAEVIASLK